MSEIPYGYCHCGCKQKTNISTKNDSSTNRVKGEPMKFINGHQNLGSNHHSWNGGRYITGQGYVHIYRPNHHFAGVRGYVLEHILVLEEALKRPLLSTECAHHIDGNRANNDIGNLILFKTKAMHSAYHARLRAFEACGHYDWRMCGHCHQYDNPKNLQFGNKRGNAAHKSCKAEYWEKYAANGYKPLKEPKFNPQEITELASLLK